MLCLEPLAALKVSKSADKLAMTLSSFSFSLPNRLQSRLGRLNLGTRLGELGIGFPLGGVVSLGEPHRLAVRVDVNATALALPVPVDALHVVRGHALG